MLSLEQLLEWWKVDEDNTGLEEWDKCTDVPGVFTIYLVSRLNRQYNLTIDISTSSWEVTSASLWLQKEGEFGMRHVRAIRADSPNINVRLMEWSRHPENPGD